MTISFVFKTPNKIHNTFGFKEQLRKSINPKVLYKCTCDTCNSVYVGKPKRHFLVRQNKYLGSLIFTDKALKYNQKNATAIQKHCCRHQHNSRPGNFKVLENAVNNFHLQLKDFLLILKTKPSLNIAKSMPLTFLIMTAKHLRELNNDLRR